MAAKKSRGDLELVCKYSGSTYLKKLGYQEYLQTPHWHQLRKLALTAADYHCQLCGCDELPLHVHHNTYRRCGEEDLADLVALCPPCHELFHTQQRLWDRLTEKEREQAKKQVGKRAPNAPPPELEMVGRIDPATGRINVSGVRAAPRRRRR
jgi:5-methylcytosine-specific restriction endonuclease McrA